MASNGFAFKRRTMRTPQTVLSHYKANQRRYMFEGQTVSTENDAEPPLPSWKITVFRLCAKPHRPLKGWRPMAQGR